MLKKSMTVGSVALALTILFYVTILVLPTPPFLNLCLKRLIELHYMVL